MATRHNGTQPGDQPSGEPRDQPGGRPGPRRPQQRLQRRLGVFDSTAIGLGSMLGAGVFVVFSPAAALAGPLLTLAVAVAGVIAYCNAVASAQLAARFPDMTGANIRNSVIAAAFLAASEQQPISQSHLERAARTEHRTTMGRVL